MFKLFFYTSFINFYFIFFISNRLSDMCKIAWYYAHYTPYVITTQYLFGLYSQKKKKKCWLGSNLSNRYKSPTIIVTDRTVFVAKHLLLCR